MQRAGYVLKRKNNFIAYAPALSLSTCGHTFEEAKKNFAEAVNIFFEECLEHDTLEKALEQCGWTQGKEWTPPAVVGQIDMPVEVCL